MALLFAGCMLPVAFSTPEVTPLASAYLPPRMLPPVHAIVFGPWLCSPHRTTEPMAPWERDAERDRQLSGIDCDNTFF